MDESSLSIGRVKMSSDNVDVVDAKIKYDNDTDDGRWIDDNDDDDCEDDDGCRKKEKTKEMKNVTDQS